MHRYLAAVGLLCLVALASSFAQERVTPEKSKGGQKWGQRWEHVPESFRNLDIPEWPIPTDLKEWETAGRANVRTILLECLGEMPPRPNPKDVKVLSKEDHGFYTVEKFEFFNGVDMTVPGVLVLPKDRKGPVPVIVGMHGHSGVKEEYVPNPNNERSNGMLLVRAGYAVAAIDGYFNGERIGKGPRTSRGKNAADQELSLFKLNLWKGRTLWGMQVRDELCLLDYLETRPEIDSSAIGATGASMGCTRAWWTSALDDRVKVVVGVICFTRYTELLAHGSSHGIYYFVPGLMKHFDTEAIYALTAPRPMLQLSGDQDHGAPPDGVEVLEQKVGAVYKLYGKPEHFRSILYKDTGHEYLREMRDEMVAWFQKWLPVNRSE